MGHEDEGGDLSPEVIKAIVCTAIVAVPVFVVVLIVLILKNGG